MFIYKQDDPRWSELIKIYDGDERVSGIRTEEWGFVPKEGEPWSVKGVQFVTTPALGKQDPTYFILNGPVPVIYKEDGYVEIGNA